MNHTIEGSHAVTNFVEGAPGHAGAAGRGADADHRPGPDGAGARAPSRRATSRRRRFIADTATNLTATRRPPAAAAGAAAETRNFSPERQPQLLRDAADRAPRWSATTAWASSPSTPSSNLLRRSDRPAATSSSRRSGRRSSGQALRRRRDARAATRAARLHRVRGLAVGTCAGHHRRHAARIQTVARPAAPSITLGPLGERHRSASSAPAPATPVPGQHPLDLRALGLSRRISPTCSPAPRPTRSSRRHVAHEPEQHRGHARHGDAQRELHQPHAGLQRSACRCPRAGGNAGGIWNVSADRRAVRAQLVLRDSTADRLVRHQRHRAELAHQHQPHRRFEGSFVGTEPAGRDPRLRHHRPHRGQPAN